MMANKTVLVVDGVPETGQKICGWLNKNSIPILAATGDDALVMATSTPPPDLILIDAQSPGVMGYEVCRRLKQLEHTQAIPILFLTDPLETAEVEQAFQCGATDCLAKPIDPQILQARVHSLLMAQNAEAHCLEQAASLEAILLTVGSLAETRSIKGENHVQRTALFIRLLAEALRDLPRLKHTLTPEFIELMVRAAPLHDLGKLGISDAILLKPGKLTDLEFEEIKKHTLHGRDALLSAEQRLKVTSPLLEMGRTIAVSHHERWDGSGYPQGLAGEKIPLPGRLMAVADVYDALVTYRIYKPTFSHDVAMEIIRGGKGSQFDPDVVDALTACEAQFQGIALEYLDLQS